MPNIFTHHPHEVGENYVEHLGVALRFGMIMTLGGLAVIVHAFLPFLFVKTGSRTMDRLYRRMKRRADAPDWERHPII